MAQRVEPRERSRLRVRCRIDPPRRLRPAGHAAGSEPRRQGVRRRAPVRMRPARIAGPPSPPQPRRIAAARTGSSSCPTTSPARQSWRRQTGSSSSSSRRGRARASAAPEGSVAAMWVSLLLGPLTSARAKLRDACSSTYVTIGPCTSRPSAARSLISVGEEVLGEPLAADRDRAAGGDPVQVVVERLGVGQRWAADEPRRADRDDSRDLSDEVASRLELAREELDLDLAVAARDHAQRGHLRVRDVEDLAGDAADRQRAQTRRTRRLPAPSARRSRRCRRSGTSPRRTSAGRRSRR